MKKNILKAAISLALSAGAMQAHAATATYDPATNVVDIPAVDVLNSKGEATSYSAKLTYQGGKFVVTNVTPTAAATGDRVTYDATTTALHFPSVSIPGQSDIYAKLKYIPGSSNPIAFSYETSAPTDFTQCPAFAEVGPVDKTCVLKGEINQDITLTANTTWILSGGVYIGGDKTNSATIWIQPGTKLIGEKGKDYLYIRRGSKIMAEGTPNHPIVMTGAQEQTRGEWGGLLIAGYSILNNCNEGTVACEAAFEAITSEHYGGDNPADNSGLLKYVQVKWAGFAVRPDQELNGLTLMGVGTGTTIDFVQVDHGLDDGVEMFGGTPRLRHMVLTNNADDSLDWGSGWRGKAQYVLIKQAADIGDMGIEADNNEENNDALPRAQPLLANMTVLAPDGASRLSQGAKFRRGTGVNVYNSVFSGFTNYCIRLDGTSTYISGGTSAADLTGTLTIEGSYVNCPTNFNDAESVGYTTEEWFTAQANNAAGDPLLNGIYPADNSPLLTDGVAIVDNGADSGPDNFLDQTSYTGAFKNADDKWAEGWTAPGSF